MIKVDFEETVRKGRLVGGFSRAFNIVLLAVASLIALFAVYNVCVTEDDTSNSIYLFVVGPVLVAGIGYAFYKKGKEDKLFSIVSTLPVDTKKEILAAYIDAEDMYTDYAEGNYLIATKRLYFKQWLQLTVIFTDDAVLLNVICESSKLGTPFFFYDNWVRRDIAYDINNYGQPKGEYLEQEYRAKVK